MLGATSQKQGQFRYGKYLGAYPNINPKTAPFFTYEQMGEKDRQYNQIVQNLISVEESVVIRTNYNHPWKNQHRVQLQDGKQYIINNVREYEDEVNPQAFSILKSGSDTLYYMELIRCDEDE